MKKSIEPETEFFNGVEHFKVFYNKILYQSVKATKFQLKSKQIINNYRVKYSNNEVWIPDFQFLNPATRSFADDGFYIWIRKEFYKKMAFV